ncbi:MAG: hypothetical protein AABY22_16215 [Nanoarchaeota archaeon]
MSNTTRISDRWSESIKINQTIIGISGLAKSGKDSFYKILSEKLTKSNKKVIRLALADDLKEELKDWCIKNYGIDPVSCNSFEKELIRPLLVFHGNIQRYKTLGEYWTKKIDKKINQHEDSDIFVVTDIRYDEYEKDEIPWLRSKPNSILVHISKSLLTKNYNGIFERKKHLPPNKEELENDPKLRKKADFFIEWEHIEGFTYDQILQQIEPHVERFLDEFPGLR